MTTIVTPRLLIRAPVERDRSRFVELFTDDEFTVFSDGVHDVESANARFDRMLDLAATVPYAKQPIVERATDNIVGYTGVDTVYHDEIERFEWGWRLTPTARGRGYATEAAEALLAVADARDDGELLCIIATDNTPSRRVADKLGFRSWRRFTWPDGVETELLLKTIGAGGPPLAPDSSFR